MANKANKPVANKKWLRKTFKSGAPKNMFVEGMVNGMPHFKFSDKETPPPSSTKHNKQKELPELIICAVAHLKEVNIQSVASLVEIGVFVAHTATSDSQTR